jgi:hypothetical protein
MPRRTLGSVAPKIAQKDVVGIPQPKFKTHKYCMKSLGEGQFEQNFQLYTVVNYTLPATVTKSEVANKIEDGGGGHIKLA